jgi:oxalate decarboxylase/phosphoglucose isomerase-like protein (cupin superfamily)
MAATHTPTCNPVKITVSGTSDNSIDLSNVMRSGEGECTLDWVSGTTIYVNVQGATVAASAILNTTQNKMIIRVQKGDYIYVKGSAGSETFNISVL